MRTGTGLLCLAVLMSADALAGEEVTEPQVGFEDTDAFALQAEDGVLAARSDDRRLLVVPMADETTPPRVIAGDGIRFEVGVENGFRVYRAWYQGRTHTTRAPVDGPQRRFAFDPKHQRFDEVTSTLRVRVTDFDRLDEVIDAAGASDGKGYPALGWALLRLPAEANPAAVARELSEHELVTGAEIVLRGPRRFPQ